MKRAFVFPGQGSQFVGMGKELAQTYPLAKEIFQNVDEALNRPLFKLMTHGDPADLMLTHNAQPALMAVSLAVTRVLESLCDKPLKELGAFVAGHSLGEYSALAAAQSFSIKTAAKLLELRGKAMQQAVPVGQGAMAAIIGLDFKSVEEIAYEASRQGGICVAANDNATGQVVISGINQAVELAIAIALEAGAKRAIKLPVSAPFHSPLMKPAQEAMTKALARIDLQSPSLPLVCNVTATSIEDPEEIKIRLIEQVCGRVRWRESVLFMKEQGVEEIVELGASKILTGLTRRIDRSIKGKALYDPVDIEKFAETISQQE